MHIKRLHGWDISPSEAVSLQKELRSRISTEGGPDNVSLVAGLDVSTRGDMAVGAVVVLDFPGLKPVETAIVHTRLAFPYIAGLLSFREVPVLSEALAKLQCSPQMLMVDGQGIAHPRRMGIASHIGLLTGVPAIGCAKSRLWGKYEEPGEEKGDYTWLCDGSERIGAVLRTRKGVKPVFISVGNGIDLEKSIDFVMRCTIRYRLPEPTRLAHIAAGKGWERA